MKKGFTLVEIIIVLAIMAIILGSAVMSVGTGMKSARLRDAARTVQLYTRHAKAVALLKQRPVVLQFEEVCENGQFLKSRVSLTFSGDATGSGEQGIGVGHNGSGSSDGLTRTLSGLVVGADVTAEGFLAPSDDTDEAPDPLMAEPREFEGIRIQAKLKEEEVARSRISVFSNADTLLKRKAEADAAKREQEQARAERLGKVADKKADDKEDEAFKEEEEKESSFSVVYEANGRCDPFLVNIFKDGTDERDGLTVSIGRFGRTVTGD